LLLHSSPLSYKYAPPPQMPNTGMALNPMCVRARVLCTTPAWLIHFPAPTHQQTPPLCTPPYRDGPEPSVREGKDTVYYSCPAGPSCTDTPINTPSVYPPPPPFTGMALNPVCVRVRTQSTTPAPLVLHAPRRTAGWSCSTTQASSSTSSVRGSVEGRAAALKQAPLSTFVPSGTAAKRHQL
jgi:hypothetical protein